MARNTLLFSVALNTATFSALSATALVGDFTLHNSSSGQVTVANAGNSTGFVLAAGKSLKLNGVDLNAIVARSELSGASLSITGLFGA